MRHKSDRLQSVDAQDAADSSFSVDALLRVITTIVGALIGWELGLLLANVVPIEIIPFSKRYYQFILMLAFALLGFAAGPYVTVKPYRALRNQLRQLPARALIMGIIGSLIGLLIAALLALPLSLLPGAFGQLLPFAFALILASIGATTMVIREKDIATILGLFATRETSKRNVVLLDTSVIIDGRIADVCQSGFLSGTLLVPRFVLEELQRIADSGEALRRNRGRRGLDVLNKMQKDQRISMEICDMDAPEIREVDGKLIKLAQQLDCPIFTNDYNLNRVAELQGVRVLNINELANAVKAVVLPGESLHVQIIQEGKEAGQGVAYLDDGTMVVVEDGKRWMHAAVDITVTRILQTVAGRMIFGQIEEEKR